MHVFLCGENKISLGKMNVWISFLQKTINRALSSIDIREPILKAFFHYFSSQEVQVLGLLEYEIFKGDIRPNLCVCVCVCFR